MEGSRQGIGRGFEKSPVHRLLGFELVARTPSGAEIRMPVRREFIQEEGVVQGGILTALADAAAVYVLLPDLPADQGMTSIELKLNFLRPAVEGQGDLVARSTLVKRGKTIALLKSEVFQDGKAVAEGLFTYLFLERADPA